MSKTSHTPGPWVAEPNGGRGSWVKGSNGEWAALACGMLDSTAEANARLIAAAPELLAALKAILDETGGIGGPFTAARAAIAKATKEERIET